MKIRLVGGSRDGQTIDVENAGREVSLFPELPPPQITAAPLEREVSLSCPDAEVYLRSLRDPTVYAYVIPLGFVDRCEGGHGRTSIKKSHRAEGRNFVD